MSEQNLITYEDYLRNLVAESDNGFIVIQTTMAKHLADWLERSRECEEVVYCRDCKWYEKPHIKYNDGTKKYFDSEAEIEFVTADIGSNIGGECVGHKTYCTAHDRENPEDYEELVIFRNTNDYCSYGERKE